MNKELGNLILKKDMRRFTSNFTKKRLRGFLITDYKYSKREPELANKISSTLKDLIVANR